MTQSLPSHTSARAACDALRSGSAPVSRKDADAIIPLLGDPRSEIRDDLASPSLARSILDGRLDAELPWLEAELCGPRGLEAKEDSTASIAVLARSFAALIIAVVLNRSRALGGALDDRVTALDAIETRLRDEDDLRSWQPEYGWIHIVAHLADATDELFEFEMDAPRATGLAAGLVGLVLRRADALFSFGEYDRVAFALATALRRGRIGRDAMADLLALPGAAEHEFTSIPASVVRANHLRALSRAIHFKLVAEEAGSELIDWSRSLCLPLT
ncbi:MAG: DUF2785 domain-containing protein [Spirochaetota bacterium]